MGTATEAVVKVAALLGTMLLFKHYDRHPLGPFEKIGSSAYAKVVNVSSDTMTVCAMARGVDKVVRAVGVVAPRDSAFLLLPYADTKVTLLLGGGRVCPSHWEEARAYIGS